VGAGALAAGCSVLAFAAIALRLDDGELHVILARLRQAAGLRPSVQAAGPRPPAQTGDRELGPGYLNLAEQKDREEVNRSQR
jgi:hypothetical protein